MRYADKMLYTQVALKGCYSSCVAITLYSYSCRFCFIAKSSCRIYDCSIIESNYLSLYDCFIREFYA